MHHHRHNSPPHPPRSSWSTSTSSPPYASPTPNLNHPNTTAGSSPRSDIDITTATMSDAHAQHPEFDPAPRSPPGGDYPIFAPTRNVRYSTLVLPVASTSIGLHAPTNTGSGVQDQQQPQQLQQYYSTLRNALSPRGSSVHTHTPTAPRAPETDVSSTSSDLYEQHPPQNQQWDGLVPTEGSVDVEHVPNFVHNTPHLASLSVSVKHEPAEDSETCSAGGARWGLHYLHHPHHNQHGQSNIASSYGGYGHRTHNDTHTHTHTLAQSFSGGGGGGGAEFASPLSPLSPIGSSPTAAAATSPTALDAAVVSSITDPDTSADNDDGVLTSNLSSSPHSAHPPHPPHPPHPHEPHLPHAMTAPLRAVNASKEMRRMMGVFRLNPFMMVNGERVKSAWDGSGAGPLESEPLQIEFRVVFEGMVIEDEDEDEEGGRGDGSYVGVNSNSASGATRRSIRGLGLEVEEVKSEEVTRYDFTGASARPPASPSYHLQQHQHYHHHDGGGCRRAHTNQSRLGLSPRGTFGTHAQANGQYLPQQLSSPTITSTTTSSTATATSTGLGGLGAVPFFRMRLNALGRGASSIFDRDLERQGEIRSSTFSTSSSSIALGTNSGLGHDYSSSPSTTASKPPSLASTTATQDNFWSGPLVGSPPHGIGNNNGNGNTNMNTNANMVMNMDTAMSAINVMLRSRSGLSTSASDGIGVGEANVVLTVCPSSDPFASVSAASDHAQGLYDDPDVTIVSRELYM